MLSTRIASAFLNRSLLSSAAKKTFRQNLIQSPTRLFGSKAGVPGNPPGEIFIDDDQQTLKIDLEKLRQTISNIRTLIGYETYDISLLLVEDDEMKESNKEARGINAPTDILSFPFHPPIEPGKLMEPDFDIADYYNLGDMMVDVPYVIRQTKEDEEYEDDDEEDRGVSGAMAKIYDPEQRIHMLLVHGMLHLVGYDHENDDEYELMVAKEEEFLEKLGMLPTEHKR